MDERMMVSRLLKSCATPPVSWPTASIFCAWRKRLLGPAVLGDVATDAVEDALAGTPVQEMVR